MTFEWVEPKYIKALMLMWLSLGCLGAIAPKDSLTQPVSGGIRTIEYGDRVVRDSASDEIHRWASRFMVSMQCRDRKSIRKLIGGGKLISRSAASTIDSLIAEIPIRRNLLFFKIQPRIPMRLVALRQHPSQPRYYSVDYVMERENYGMEDLRLFVILDDCSHEKPVPLVVQWQEMSIKPHMMSDYRLNSRMPPLSHTLR